VADLHYLTVQDLIWVNLQVTKKVHHFHYANLEEGTFGQYGYGPSHDLVRQAGRFLSDVARLEPFSAGNEATAFVGALAFLELNGREVTLTDAEGADWFAEALRTPVAAIERVTRAAHGEHASLDVRASLGDILARYPTTIDRLAALQSA
jgi:prophage maintenance system killer protein